MGGMSRGISIKFKIKLLGYINKSQGGATGDLFSPYDAALLF